MSSLLGSAPRAGVFGQLKISVEFTVKAMIGGSDFVGDMGMYISFLHTPNEFLHRAPQPLDLVVAYASFALTPLATAWYGAEENRWDRLSQPAVFLRLFSAALYLLAIWQTFFEVPTRLLCLGLVLNSAWLGLHILESLVHFNEAIAPEDWHREPATGSGSSKRGRRAVLGLCAASAVLVTTGLVVAGAFGQRHGLVELRGLPQSAMQRNDEAFDVFVHTAFFEGLPVFARTSGDPALLFFRHSQSVEHDDSVLVLARSLCAQRYDRRAEESESVGGRAGRVLRILPSFLNFEDTLCFRNWNSLGDALGMRSLSVSEGGDFYMAFKTFREVTSADESRPAERALNFGNQGFEEFLALAQREGTWHVWDGSLRAYAVDQSWNITVDRASPMVQLQELCRECGAEADAFARSSLRQQVLPDRTQEGHSPLSIAARHGCAPVAGVLLEGGADVNQTDSQTGASPLWLAAKFGHGKVSEMLMQHGAGSETPYLKFELPSVLEYSNLANKGPRGGHGHGEGLVYKTVYLGHGAGREFGKEVYLIINATSRDYHPFSPRMNGMQGEFGCINLNSGSHVDLEFSFFDRATKEQMTIPDLALTFFDLDTGHSGKSKEYVSIGGFKSYYLTEHTEVQVSDAPGGQKRFSASTYGSGEDNPTSARFLTQQQKNRALTLLFDKVKTVKATIGAEAGIGPRFFTFVGRPSLLSPVTVR